MNGNREPVCVCVFVRSFVRSFRVFVTRYCRYGVFVSFWWVFERVRVDGRLKIRLKSAPIHPDSQWTKVSVKNNSDYSDSYHCKTLVTY